MWYLASCCGKAGLGHGAACSCWATQYLALWVAYAAFSGRLARLS